MLRHLTLVWISLFLLLTAATCSKPPSFIRQAPEPAGDMAIISEAWAVLKERSIFKNRLNTEEFSHNTIRSLLQTLEDPHASFLTPQEMKMHSQNYTGEITGIGVEATMYQEHLTVISPLPNTPASRAGIRSGDIILEVDGEPVATMTFLQALMKIRGPKGTSVKLLIQHDGQTVPELIHLTRDSISTPSVKMEMLDGNIAYIGISSFLENTDESFETTLDQAIDQGALALILDLRNNPGGVVTSTVSITSQFLSEGLVFYQVEDAGMSEQWEVESGGIAQTLPLVVLVNEHSASSSEIVAGALQDHDRALVVGTQTFGKGTVNILAGLSDGSGLFFSIGYWHTPRGSRIEGQGIAPDIIVAQPPQSSVDAQLQRASDLLESILRAPPSKSSS